MGCYPRTYIGIFMEVPHKSEMVKVKKFVHPTTGREMKFAFDPNTGVKANEVFEEKPQFTSAKWALSNAPESYEFDEDEFWSPEYTGAPEKHSTLILNRNDTKYTEGVKGNSFNFAINHDFDVRQIIADFKVEYKKQIDYLEENFGPFKIQYGVVHYYH